MSTDPRLLADAELLESLAQGNVPEGDARLRQLVERRPEWRELVEHARAGAEWTAAASEADRRLVAECLAEARVSRPAAAAVLEPRAQRHAQPSGSRRKLYVALAAALVAAGALLLWWPRGGDQTTTPGQLLDSSVDWIEPGTVASDFSEFTWKLKSTPLDKPTYVLTIWADGGKSGHGRRLFRHEVETERMTFGPDETADWPDSVIWRIDRVDTGLGTSLSPEWRAQRKPR